MATPETEGELATLAVASPVKSRPSQTRASGPLTRGDVVGRYVVLERLGVGGMGEVYAAYDPELDRKIAIKLLLPGSSDSMASTSGHARLLREAQAMAKLHHPNVVAVHDVGTHDVRVFVAMEFVDGGNLADWISDGSDGNGKPRAWPDVIARFLAAGEGLVAAHAAGLIHRDFKPANVLLGRDGAVRVADFGLARQAVIDPDSPETVAAGKDLAELEPHAAVEIDEIVETDEHEPLPSMVETLKATIAGPSTIAGGATLMAGPSMRTPTAARSLTGRSINSLSMRMTMTGAMLGTPAYMAPEQYQSQADIDARADQFSFCVALWEALYGQRPYAGDNLHVLMFAIHQGNLREPPVGIEVPATIRRALVRGLAHDPSKRWPDMRALLTELRFDPRARKRKLALGFGGLALLAAVAWGAVASRPDPVEPEPVCTGAGAAFGDALSDERRAAVAAGFAKLDQAWAHELGERMLPRLDAWQRDWEAAWTDACEDTHVRSEQSTELLDRRLLCLDRQRRGFIKLVDGFAQVDTKLAKKAHTLLAELGSIAACSDSEALLRLTPMPDDPELVAAIEIGDQAVSDAHGLFLANKLDEAKRVLDDQAERIAKADYAPLSASYEQLRGRLVVIDDAAAGEQALERSFALALEAGDDRRAGKIARSLAYELQQLERNAEATRWLLIASALAERLDDDELRGTIAITRSQVLASLGDYAGAEASAQIAYDVLSRTNPDDAVVGDALYLLGMAAYRAGRYDDTVVMVEKARAAWSSDIGPGHPRTVAGLSLLGGTARETGDHAKAEAYFREALAIDVDTFGADHIQATSHRSNLAVVLGDQGKFDEAIMEIEKVLAIRRATPDAGAAWTGRTLVNLAQIQREAGRLDDARKSLDEGAPLVLAAVGPDHPDLVVQFHIAAMLDLAQGDLDAAERNSQEALRLATKEYGADSPVLFELRTGAAKIALARGKPQLAAERLVGPHADDTSPKWIGEHEFVQAQVDAALGDQAKSIEAANRAKQAFVEDGAGSVAALAEVEAWLAAHD